MRRILAPLATTLAVLALAPAAALAADGTLSGRVGVDATTPVPGAELELSPVFSVKLLTTDAAGRYSVSLPEGAYTLRFQDGYRMIAPSTQTVEFTVVAGQETVVEWTVRGSRVLGSVFDDFDDDGAQDPGEVPLADVEVKILAKSDFYVTTGAEGSFTSGPPVLPAGGFSVDVDAPPGYESGLPPFRNVAAGEDFDAGALGVHTPTGFAEGSVYLERIGEPGRQPYEEGLAGAAVTVAYTLWGVPYSRTVRTDDDGRYRVGVAADRPLTISQAQPAHWADGPDFTPVLGAVSGEDTFTAPGVADAASTGPFDFGEFAARIEGYAFIDRDRDGILDPVHDEHTGAVTLLVTAPGGFSKTLDTDFSGAYSVELPGGEVTITITNAIAGAAPGPARTVDVPLGGSLIVDLPFYTPSVEGTVRDTTTGAPVGGATVTYLDAATGASREMESGEDGGFRFDDVATTAAAELRVTAPAGFVLSDSVPGSLGGSAAAGAVTGFAVGDGELGTGFVLGLASPAVDVPPEPTAAPPVATPPVVAPPVMAPPAAPPVAARVTLLAGARTSLSGNGFRLGCRLDAGAARRCDFAVRTPGGRLLATGSASAGGDARRLDATLRLTHLGRRLTRRAPGGVSAVVDVRATQAAGGAALEASRRTVLIRPGRYTVPGTIFAPGTARLTTAGQQAIRALVARLEGARRVVCEGHTDSIGTEADNLALGLARARTVCAALRSAGLDDSNLVARSRGESRPRATNFTAAGRALNRRVVLLATVR